MAFSWTTATQIAANTATVIALVYAAMTLHSSSIDARLASSAKLLEQGVKMEADYRDGKIDARQVVAFYYLVFLYRRMDRLDDAVYGPVNRSLCKFIKSDPRAKEYWAGAAKDYDGDFVAFVNQNPDPKLC